MRVNKDGYIICPKCGNKTKIKVNKDTILVKFPMWCGWCKSEHVISHPTNLK